MKRKLLTVFLLLGLVLPAFVLAGPTKATPGVKINEIRIDQPSTDNDEYFELAGGANESLDGLTYLVIGDGTGGSGVIEAVVDLTGNSIPASGFFVAAESTFTLGKADLVVDLNFENSDNVTHLLVRNFSGANGDDLDTNDDGVLDSTPWTELVDLIALVEEENPPSNTEFHYGPPSVGPDGSFVPGHALFCPSGFPNDWVIGNFSGGDDTPGAVNSTCPPPPIPLTIMEIQGSDQFSQFDGQSVETSGVVTLFTANGVNFWLQDPNGDGDLATSDGIFVSGGGFPASGPRPEVGDSIRIIAMVNEQQFGNALPLTRLRAVALIEILSSDNPLPASVPLINLPNEIITDGIDFWEPLEGMLVSIENGFVTSATNGFGEFGMLTEADADAELGSGYFANTKQILVRDLGGGNVDYNPERVMVDDSSLHQAIQVQPGDRIRSMVGVVDYTFSMYKLQPASFDVKTRKLPEVPLSTRSGGFGNVTITTFNVENLFDLEDNPEKEDEGSTPRPDELETKLAKLAMAIEIELDLPEIIVVQEIENQAIAQELGDLVNTAAGTNYVASSFETSDARGIEVGFLWDANRVALLDAFQMSGPDVEHWFGPSSPSPGREPLVGVFDIMGHQVTIVGNHFKSKGGDDPLYGVHQPPIRVTEFQRKGQAQTVRNFVNAILDADPNALVMVAGDLNDFQFSEPGEGPDNPVAILEGINGEVPLTNLLGLEKDSETFTFVFDGNAQVLDHMLVSPALLDLFVGTDILHFNASFPDDLSSDVGTALRSSDHDPLEGRFAFEN